MKKTSSILILAGLILLAVGCGKNRTAAVQEQVFLCSPDSVLALEFRLLEDGTAQYALQREGKDVILPSRLGFDLRGSLMRTDVRPCYSFSEGFELVNVAKDSFDETWETVWGEERLIRNHYQELLVELRHKPTAHLMSIRFRLYDDGLGFRYEFPGDPTLGYFVIKEEKTQFAMAGDHTAWWIPMDFSSQEYEYTTSRLSGIPADNGVQTSIQMKTDDGLYINLHEAALVN